eukprot:TRINITY_DN7252_c0_g1_i1.p1 TRINITY_DN7252_c0_g1~~TRINITY_DN7252_c0_g1_i1.p1  ORF type:complete len:273 (+),score=17.11 TRINITY_DN7252_c0_g1_i1:64-882(+)
MTSKPADLIALCKEGDIEKLKNAFSAETVNQRIAKNTGPLPLAIAARVGQLGAVQYFLSIGADPKLHSVLDEGIGETTPLVEASEAGHLAVVQALLDAGADVNAARNGDTPLILASRKGHLEVVKTLLAADADVLAVQRDGLSALFFAAERGDDNIVRALLTYGPVGPSSTSPLWIAAKEGYLDVVQRLLTGGADCDVIHDNNRYTPLHIACQAGRLEVVKALLSAGADVAARTMNDETPLNLATKYGHHEVIKELNTRSDSNAVTDGATSL